MDAIADQAPDLAEQLRSRLEKDPFGPGWTGAFFPSHGETKQGIPFREDFEELGDDKTGLLLRLRHIPTKAVLERLAQVYGDKACALVGEWLAAWQAVSGGPDAFATTVGYQYPAPDAPDLLDSHHATQVLKRRAGRGEAIALYHTASLSRYQIVARDPEQHMLEDAAVMTSLLRHRVPFTLLADFNADAALLVSFKKAGFRSITPIKPKKLRPLVLKFAAANAYWALPSFHAFSGRKIVETFGTQHLTLTLLDMARQGHQKAFLKDGIFKGGTWVVELAGVKSEPEAAFALIQALGPRWFAILSRLPPHDTQLRCITVQEFVPFEYEHRFFIVKGRIAASTSSDRTLSMLDVHPKGRIDPRVAKLATPASTQGPYDRGQTTTVENRALVAAMTRLVRKFLHEMTENDFVARVFLADAFAIDVGAGTNGIGLIEINTFRNAGLYAADYDRVAKALSHIERWGPSKIKRMLSFVNPTGSKVSHEEIKVTTKPMTGKWTVARPSNPENVWSTMTVKLEDEPVADDI